MRTRRSYVQDFLWSRKSEFLMLEELHSARRLAKIFGIGKDSIYKFKNSSRFKEFKLMVFGDMILEEVLKEYKHWSVEEGFELNAMTEVQVKAELVKMYLSAQ
jgi:hypothetical protein